MFTEAVDFNSDVGCSRARDPDTHCSWQQFRPYVIIAQDRMTNNSLAWPQWRGGPRIPTRPQVVAQILVIPVALGGNMITEVNRDLGCGSAMKPDRALGWHSAKPLLWLWVASRPPTSAASPSPSLLSTVLLPSTSLSPPFLHHTSLILMTPTIPTSVGQVCGCCQPA